MHAVVEVYGRADILTDENKTAIGSELLAKAISVLNVAGLGCSTSENLITGIGIRFRIADSLDLSAYHVEVTISTPYSIGRYTGSTAICASFYEEMQSLLPDASIHVWLKMPQNSDQLSNSSV